MNPIKFYNDLKSHGTEGIFFFSVVVLTGAFALASLLFSSYIVLKLSGF